MQIFYISDRDWEDMKKMPEHQTLVKDFKKIKYSAIFISFFFKLLPDNNHSVAVLILLLL